MQRKHNRLLLFAQLGYAVAQRVMPPYASKFSPKTYTQPQLLACLLLKEYLRQDYRTVEETLELSEALRVALELRRVPDFSTLWWFAKNRVNDDLLQRALTETIRLAQSEPLEPEPPLRQPGLPKPEPPLRQVALDSTGLWLSYTSRYFEWRAKRDRGQRGWLKWAIACWVEPQMLLAQRVRPGPCGDFADLVPLATAARTVLPFDQVIADAGYDSEANHRYCEDVLGVQSLIPARARRSRTLIAKTFHRQRMVRLLDTPGNPVSQAQYRQRWKIETVMSVVKRKWGEGLTTRHPVMQDRQALLRGLVYNLHRLVTFCCVWWIRTRLQQRPSHQRELFDRASHANLSACQ